LKHVLQGLGAYKGIVAPRTGAWIETGMNRIINRVV